MCVLCFTTDRASCAFSKATVRRCFTAATAVLVNEIARGWKTEWVPPTVLLPMNTSNHWGMICAIPNRKSPGEGEIFWGDSLNFGPTSGVLVVVNLAMNVLNQECPVRTILHNLVNPEYDQGTHA